MFAKRICIHVESDLRLLKYRHEIDTHESICFKAAPTSRIFCDNQVLSAIFARAFRHVTFFPFIFFISLLPPVI